MTGRIRRNRAEDPPLGILLCRVQPSRQPINHLHRHGQLEIGFCHAGQGVLLIEGRLLPFAAPCVALVAAEDWHFHHSAAGTTSDWTFVFVDPPRLLAPGDPGAAAAATLRGDRFPHVIGEADDPTAVAIARALAEECRKRGDIRDEAFAVATRGLVSALIAQATRLPRGERRGGAGAAAQRERLLPALRLIATRHGEPLPIPRLAASVGLAPSAFRAAFTAAFGIAPKAYVTRFRLEKAASALAADPRARVLDIALDCGFASLSAFNRRFRAAYRLPPRRWRRSRAG